MEALAVPPVPPCVELTAPVVLFCVPAAMPLTLTAKLHGALAARVAPERLTLLEPAAAVIVPPPHEPVSPLGVETTSPEGSVSVNPIPLREVALFGLERLNVNVVEPFNGIEAAPKDFPIVGGATTVTEAMNVLPVPALVEFTVTLLLWIPVLVPVTLVENVQEPPTPRVAPDRLTVPVPAV